MQFSEFTLRLLLIFFPGIISAIVINKFTNNKIKDFKYFILNSYVLGMISYVILYIILVICKRTTEFHFISCLLSKESIIDFREIKYSAFIGVLQGILLSYLLNYKIFDRLGKRLLITKSYTDDDVWSYIFGKDVDWVLIRDIKNEIMYEGWVEAYSENHNYSEIFLRDVIAYDNLSADELYKLDGIYLTFKKDEIKIEFRDLS